MSIDIGLQGISITDHDTFVGFHEAYPYGLSKGLTILPGLEISTECLGEPVHVLGYSFDPGSTSLEAFCRTHRARREQRGERIVEKLSHAGMPVTMDEVRLLSPEASSYGRVHIALAMLKHGYIKNVKEAFSRHIGTGKPCYVSGEKWVPEEAVRAIHSAGGKAVIAHPHLIKSRSVVDALLSLPFDGVEAYYSNYSAQENLRWAKAAEQRGWFVTGGSDFHGEVRPDIPLGLSWTREKTFDLLHKHFLEYIRTT